MYRDIIRRCLFRPYGPGKTVFTLVMWDTHRVDSTNHTKLGYRLMLREPGAKPVTVFEGKDFGCPSCTAIDSDECVNSLMGFLCLQYGDTDREYFDGYTELQHAFREQHAEYLGYEVQARYEREQDVA